MSGVLWFFAALLFFWGVWRIADGLLTWALIVAVKVQRWAVRP